MHDQMDNRTIVIGTSQPDCVRDKRYIKKDRCGAEKIHVEVKRLEKVAAREIRRNA